MSNSAAVMNMALIYLQSFSAAPALHRPRSKEQARTPLNIFFERRMIPVNSEHNYFVNPMIRKLTRVKEQPESDSAAASYKGVAHKTFFFLLWSIVGVALFFVLRPTLTAGEVITLDNGLSFHILEAGAFFIALLLSVIAPLLAFLIKPLVPFLGSLYCLCFSYSFACLDDLVPEEFGGIICAAAIITVILVLVMAHLYASGKVNVTKKTRTVILTLFLTALLSGLIVFLLSLIPGFQPMIGFLEENAVVGIIVSILYIVIACLLLLVDFQTIQQTIERGLPKKYEWIAAFGLAYTIFYLFLQVFNLLSRIQNSGKAE